ncbi:polysaccharide deacetylase family protein [Clostridium estertheticum]|uniref:polysaccharide deacetylase family protein n=1 Tax=Clostridium estertheticum TaxID=238834 RepID=UPI001CF5EF22|nr:polysaccharide deacetylase family protein [Clostridium estertheticum]MCB2354007.1 polysaccharide deacetylase family protein [Clostridium estertheticum]WAG43144.1 polysaccharide deacetylase family protein [Clostridium estertheticum]
MKKIAFIYSNESFKNQIEYVVNTIFQDYDIDVFVISLRDFKCLKQEFDLIISYGNTGTNDDGHMVILEGPLFSQDYLTLKSIPTDVLFYEGLPVFFNNKGENYFKKKIKDQIIINIDIIQMSFFFLTCYEEYIIDEYDKYGRFNIEKSILYKNELLNRPIVNESIQWFVDTLNICYNLNIKKKNLWGDKKFQVLLSHDVDVVSKYFSFRREVRLQLSVLLIDKRPLDVVKRIKGYIATNLFKIQEDPCDTFDMILKTEKDKGYNSSFYFMTNGKGYSPRNKKVKGIVKEVVEGNNEIGFHPGLGTASDETLFNKELLTFKKEFNKTDKIGIRQHYLSFNAQKTWAIQEKNGINYDTTLCFPDKAGFKVGYCLPYKPYDLAKDRIMDIWEIPLIVMDGSLMQYMHLDFEESIKYIKELIQKVEIHNGIFVLLWHNSAISKEYNIHSRDIFQWFYDYIKTCNCDVTSGENIILKYEKTILEDENGIY